MFKVQCLFVCFLFYFVFESNAGLASFIKPCQWDDKSCLVSSAQAAVPFLAAGVPELGIEGADPMKIKSIKSNDGNLKIGFNNVEVRGVSKTKIRGIQRDPVKQTITVDLETPLFANGDYDLDGKILILHAEGNGKFEIQTNKVAANVVLKYNTIEKGGNEYWKINSFNYTFNLDEKIILKFDNLFNGNEQLAKPINELFDKESNLIVTEIGGPTLIKELIGQYVNRIKIFLLKVPKNELEIV